MFEREVYTLNWRGKALVLVLAPITLSGAFLSTLVVEIVNAVRRAWWELRFEWARIRMDFLR